MVVYKMVFSYIRFMERKSGYYWVKQFADDEWQIGHWNSKKKCWSVCGYDEFIYEDRKQPFIEIDENVLNPPTYYLNEVLKNSTGIVYRLPIAPGPNDNHIHDDKTHGDPTKK